MREHEEILASIAKQSDPWTVLLFSFERPDGLKPDKANGPPACIVPAAMHPRI
jgi:hypothetical protein